MKNFTAITAITLLTALGCGEKPEPTPESSGPAQTNTASSATESQSPNDTARDAVESIPMPELVLTAEEIEDGWIQLFDGVSMFGWKANNEVNWSVENGIIQADQGEPGLLVTTVPFADYEFRCDFHLEEGGNSGVFLRSAFLPESPAVDCYELNICDSHESFPTGSLVARQKPAAAVTTDGEWHSFHVRAMGNQLTVRLDGNTILEYVDESDAPLANGYIGLQKNAGKIQFRNVFLKPLSTVQLFNGQDLGGWKIVPGSKSQFEVQDGEIHVTDGPGFLETTSAYDDFVLQIQAMTRDTHLNSGVFFRALLGTEETPSGGYEMQIHNGYNNDDRSQPIDQGTGAIFRRAPARWVVADDQEWLSATLVAYGPRFSTWVNGLQVVDWVDEREPNENPRLGRKTEAGHISLQGHDPTTNLSFRKLQVAKYPAGRAP